MFTQSDDAVSAVDVGRVESDADVSDNQAADAMASIYDEIGDAMTNDGLITAIDDSVKEADDNVDNASAVVDVAEQSDGNGEAAIVASEMFVNAARHKLHMSKTSKLSRESISGLVGSITTHRKRNLMYAQAREGIVQFFKDSLRKMLDWLKSIWDYVKNIYRSYTTTQGRIKRWAETIIKKAKDAGQPNTKVSLEITDKTLAEAFRTDPDNIPTEENVFTLLKNHEGISQSLYEFITDYAKDSIGFDADIQKAIQLYNHIEGHDSNVYDKQQLDDIVAAIKNGHKSIIAKMCDMGNFDVMDSTDQHTYLTDPDITSTGVCLKSSPLVGGAILTVYADVNEDDFYTKLAKMDTQGEIKFKNKLEVYRPPQEISAENKVMLFTPQHASGIAKKVITLSEQNGKFDNVSGKVDDLIKRVTKQCDAITKLVEPILKLDKVEQTGWQDPATGPHTVDNKINVDTVVKYMRESVRETMNTVVRAMNWMPSINNELCTNALRYCDASLKRY